MKAFTAVETVIVIGLSLLILLALQNLFFNFNSVLGADGGLISAASGAGRIVREAEAVILPADRVLASHTFSGTVYASGPATLVLELPAVDNTGASVSGKYDYAAVYITGTTAYRLLEADPASARVSGTKQLSTAVQTLAFAYDNADYAQVKKVAIDARTQVVVKGQTFSGHVRQQVYLRNH